MKQSTSDNFKEDDTKICPTQRHDQTGSQTDTTVKAGRQTGRHTNRQSDSKEHCSPGIPRSRSVTVQITISYLSILVISLSRQTNLSLHFLVERIFPKVAHSVMIIYPQYVYTLTQHLSSTECVEREGES